VWFLDAFRLSKAVARLEERLIALERAWKSVDDEWSDQLDRYKRLHGRIAKRAALIEADDQRQGIEGTETGLSRSASDGPASGGMSAAQRSINDRILARRARILGGST